MGGTLSVDEFREWDAKRVAEAVGGIGTAYESYAESFVANGMTGAFILKIQEQELQDYFQEFHIDKSIHQNRFRTIFKGLVPSESPSQHGSSEAQGHGVAAGSATSGSSGQVPNDPSVARQMSSETSPRSNSKKRTELSNAQVIDTKLNSPPRKEIMNGRECDAFLSYEWAADELERNNHDRVNAVSVVLHNQGITTYTGHERKNERNPMQHTAEAIDHAHVFIVFVTTHYMEKVNGDMKNDHCQRELEYMATSDHVPTHLAIIMEPNMRDKRRWDGMFGLLLKNCPTFDLSEDTDFDAKCSELCNTIKQMIPRSEYSKRKMSSLQVPQPILPVKDVINQLLQSLQQREGSETKLHEQLVKLVILAMHRSNKSVCAEANGIGIVGSFLINPLATTQHNDFPALALLFLRNIALYNDINKEAIGKEIPLMTAIVKWVSNDSDHHHQVNACEVIKVLGSELRNEKSFVALGAITSLLNLIKVRGNEVMNTPGDQVVGVHDSNVRVLESALLALASLMIEREHKVVALENDAVNLLLGLLISPRLHTKAKCKVCGALQKIARINEVAVEIGNRNAIPHIRNLLVTSEHVSHFLQGLVVGLLTRLSYVNENESLLSQPDTIAALVQVLRFAKDDAKSDALLLMRNLTFNEAFAQVIASVPQIFTILVELMENGSEKIRVNAGDALNNLCELQVNRSKAVDAQVLPRIIDLIQRGIHTSNDEEAMAMHDVVTYCIESLTKLADLDVTRAPVRMAGAPLIMLEIVRNGSKSHESAATKCIEKLALDPAIQVTLGANGAMEVFVAALYKGPVVQRETSLSVLTNLMLHETNQRLFLEKSGGMKALGMCLEENFLMEKHKVDALQLLSTLIQYELTNPCDPANGCVRQGIHNLMSGSGSMSNLAVANNKPILVSPNNWRSQRPTPNELSFVQIDLGRVLKTLSECEDYSPETRQVAKAVQSSWNQLAMRVQEHEKNTRLKSVDALPRPVPIEEDNST